MDAAEDPEKGAERRPGTLTTSAVNLTPPVAEWLPRAPAAPRPRPIAQLHSRRKLTLAAQARLHITRPAERLDPPATALLADLLLNDVQGQADILPRRRVSVGEQTLE